jgi:hypothetical protein
MPSTGEDDKLRDGDMRDSPPAAFVLVGVGEDMVRVVSLTLNRPFLTSGVLMGSEPFEDTPSPCKF